MNLERVDGSPHPGRLELERHFFSGRRDSAIARHVDACPQCAAAVHDMGQQRDDFLRDHPPQQVLQPAFVQAEARQLVHRSSRVPLLLAVCAAALVLLVIVLGRGPGGASPDGLRLKGGSELSLLTMSTRGWQPAPEGQWPAQGDEVRFAVSLTGPGYPALLARQDDGETYLLYPGQEEQPQVPGGRSTILAGAAVLDDYGGGERVYLFTASSPWTTEELDALLQAPQLWAPVAESKATLREATR